MMSLPNAFLNQLNCRSRATTYWFHPANWLIEYVGHDGNVVLVSQVYNFPVIVDFVAAGNHEHFH